MTVFKDKIAAAIEKYGLLSKGDGVLVAVSGGPDSVALLEGLCELKKEFRLRLEVAHLQHGIRGEEARRDARFVAEIADRFGLPLHLKEVNIPSIKSDAGKGNLEALSRDERYRFLADVAVDREIGKIATGHTQDDQAETFFMWLLRGAGRKGLGGMAPLQNLRPSTKKFHSNISIIRPMIEISRAEVVEFLQGNRREYQLDRTNLDPAFLRNWIRLHLIPQLEEKFGSHLAQRLARQAELLRDEEIFLDHAALVQFQTIVDGSRLDRSALLRSEKALQRRLVRLWIEKTRGHLRGIDFDHTEAALRLVANGPPQGRISIPGGWEVVREYETVRLLKKTRTRRAACYSYTLGYEDEVGVEEAAMIIQSSRLSALPDWGCRSRDELEVFFDLASLPEKLTVRNFRPGDRFQPLGMSGRKKLKDLFIEKKVPLSVRSSLPLLSAGEDILWIPGYGRSEIAKIRPETKEILRIRAIPRQASVRD